jgi:Ca-activated chloride channel homolog
MSLSNRVHHLRGYRSGRVAVPLLIVGPVLLCALYGLLPAGTGAQSSISVTTELVVLPVSVTDSKGTFVSGLRLENFRVLEDGRPQKITLFADEDNPITVGLIVDHSRSMGPKLPGVAEAVLTFAHSSNSEDEMFVVDFGDSVSIEHMGGKDFTSDPKELEQAVAAVTARGRTALYDAIIQGLDQLRRGRRDKKALVIVSDGGDNASAHKFGDVLDLARRSHAVIYAIGLVGDRSEEENPEVLKKLCRETGGIAFFPRPEESVPDISKRIARDLREQYTLAYAPEKKAKTEAFRKIAVEVSAPGHGKMHVRTRAGYSPEPEKGSPPQPGRSTP